MGIEQHLAEPILADRDGTALRMRLDSVVKRCQDAPQRFWRDLHVGKSLIGRDAAYGGGPVRQCCTSGPNLATSSSIGAEAIGSILAT